MWVLVITCTSSSSSSSALEYLDEIDPVLDLDLEATDPDVDRVIDLARRRKPPLLLLPPSESEPAGDCPRLSSFFGFDLEADRVAKNASSSSSVRDFSRLMAFVFMLLIVVTAVELSLYENLAKLSSSAVVTEAEVTVPPVNTEDRLAVDFDLLR